MAYTLSDKEDQVYQLLMTPIQCEKKIKSISLYEGRILTGQKYINSADPDMSDFAVGFYEIIYKELLKNSSLLNDNNGFFNSAFAGDTMNSFNSIANATRNAGTSKKLRTSIEQWPQALQDYYAHYPCLANFWIIPMKIGRRSKKFNYYDSMDIFLNLLEDEYIDRLSRWQDYLERADGFKKFCDIHFIENVRDKSTILSMYKDKGKTHGEVLISYASYDIKRRAQQISKSCYSEELWSYFNRLDLI